MDEKNEEDLCLLTGTASLMLARFWERKLL